MPVPARVPAPPWLCEAGRCTFPYWISAKQQMPLHSGTSITADFAGNLSIDEVQTEDERIQIFGDACDFFYDLGVGHGRQFLSLVGLTVETSTRKHGFLGPCGIIRRGLASRPISVAGFYAWSKSITPNHSVFADDGFTFKRIQ